MKKRRVILKGEEDNEGLASSEKVVKSFDNKNYIKFKF